MGLVEELEARSSASLPGPECGVATLLSSLTEADRDDVAEAIARTGTIKSSVLQRAIKDEFGLYVSSSTLQRHRNRLCKCARTS